jgi:hypothetical protein
MDDKAWSGSGVPPLFCGDNAFPAKTSGGTPLPPCVGMAHPQTGDKLLDGIMALR